MKVLVTGGRDFSDYDIVRIVLDRLHREAPITLLIEGGAMGADHLARAWAKETGVPTRTFEADWYKHGKAAGPIRNRQMLDEGKPDMVMAFPGGRGTADMVAQARRANVVVEFAARERKDAIAAARVALRPNGPGPDGKATP